MMTDMKTDALVAKTADFVKQKMYSDGAAHDWWHVYRVCRLAKHIAKQETGANMLIVELGALLHDIADWKFTGGDLTAGPRAAREWLTSQNAGDNITDSVAYVVEHVSFRGGTNTHVMQTIEGKIVQDADRLDALGAIGIARAFAYGGSKNRSLYEPAVGPSKYESFEEYKKKGDSSTINHFYEKLLLLKDLMNTKTGKQIAQHRHDFMEKYLAEFYKEWEGEL